LSESPEGDLIKPSFPPLDKFCDGFSVFCNLARLDIALPSFGFLPCLLESGLADGALRLLLFVLRAELLVDLIRLIAATADP
jgi:hypothetical protein